MSSGASEPLVFASLAADNARAYYANLVAYLSQALGRPIRLADEPAWQLREQRLIQGDAHLGLVCGLQSVRSRERGDQPGIELLAAAVMCGQRYRREPVYFSDVIVHAGHAARTFDDLAGARFAFNERTSHSGYGVVRHALAVRGHTRGFFRSVVESGAHQRSLSLIADGMVDGCLCHRQHRARNRTCAHTSPAHAATRGDDAWSESNSTAGCLAFTARSGA